MSLFFMGLNPRWQQYKWLPPGLNVMYSAGGFWNDGRWRRVRYFRNSGLRWLDSGGFTMLNRFGDYPFSVANYMNLVSYLCPDWYAGMDYPCELEISRKIDLATNRERIQKTVMNSAKISEWENQVNSVFVPVIQGYAFDEYKHCVDLHYRAGTIRDYMAVGSMCRRISSKELQVLIPGIYEYAKQAGVKRLHFFGLKLDPSLKDLSEYIWSRDSAVSLFSYDPKLRAQRNGRRWPRGQEEKKVSFYDFLGRLNGLGLKYIKE